MSMITNRHNGGATGITKRNGYHAWPAKAGQCHAQSGATLFTALIFLIMLILLGAGAAQTSGLEERMAGNTRNRDLAFQAAEAALSYVSDILTTSTNVISTTLPSPNSLTSGTYAAAGYRAINTCLPNSANYWNGNGDLDCNGTTQQFVWSTTSPAKYPTALNMPAADTLTQIAAQPMYVVERFPDITCPTNNLLTQQQFRVTARGVGGDSNAVVILQAMLTVCF